MDTRIVLVGYSVSINTINQHVHHYILLPSHYHLITVSAEGYMGHLWRSELNWNY